MTKSDICATSHRASDQGLQRRPVPHVIHGSIGDGAWPGSAWRVVPVLPRKGPGQAQSPAWVTQPWAAPGALMAPAELSLQGLRMSDCDLTLIAQIGRCRQLRYELRMC